MHNLQHREPVLLATDFDTLVVWYREVLGLSVVQQFDDGFHYTVLDSGTGIRVGIADATEMGVVPADRANNTVVLQCQVDDVALFFKEITKSGGTIAHGPSYDARDKFWFGGFADVEGNPWWVVDKNCP